MRCCLVNEINRRRNDPDAVYIHARWALRPRLMHALEAVDEWQHRHLPRRFGMVWYWLWKPLCDLRESIYLRRSEQ